MSHQPTASQALAILTNARSLVMVAGPGSGKTATLVKRIKRLVAEETAPSKIIVLTFTNAAAREIESRLTVMAHENGDESMPPIEAKLELGFVGTLHAFALRMLKAHGEAMGYGSRISIISPESAVDLLASKAASLKCKTPMKELLELKAVGRPLRGAQLSLAQTVVATFYDDLRDAGVVDYDILLTEFHRMLILGNGPAPFNISDQFEHLMVDEAQDSAPIDWMIYDALPIANKAWVGDPDQAIYGFRGGRVALFNEQSRNPAGELILLEQNFRSAPAICRCAQRLIELNEGRVAKETISAVDIDGLVVDVGPFANEGEEIAKIAATIRGEPSKGESWAIIARTNAVADGFRQMLPHMGVPVVELKRTELPRDWRLARAFIELLVAPENDSLAFFYLIALYESKGATPKEARESAHAVRRQATAAGKSINRAKLGIGVVTRPADALKALAGEKVSREASFMVAEKFRELPPDATMLDLALTLAEVREYAKEIEGEGVRIMTMHGSKGREFDNVVIVGFEQESCPGRAVRIGEDAIAEERRLAYVAMTRARKRLFFSHSRLRSTKWEKNQPRSPSQFIGEALG